MRGPGRGDDVTVVVPQRERLTARVDGAGLGWYSLVLRDAPTTPAPLLARSQVYVEFAGIDGVGRIIGTLEVEDGHHARFRHRGGIQLLCRPEALRVRVAVPVTLLRANAPDHVALEARTVELSGAGVALRGVPTAAIGQLYQFDLHLFDREPAITGQFRVHQVAADGGVIARFTILSNRERTRLIQYLTEHSRPRRVA